VGAKAASVVLAPIPLSIGAPEAVPAATTTQPVITPPVDPAAAVSAPAVSPPAAKTYGVQAGSFQVQDNALDLVKELAKMGFNATILHDTVSGKDRYRVLAATGLDSDQAKAALGRLNAAGYAGLVVADK
jgi:cell division protein FtsN